MQRIGTQDALYHTGDPATGTKGTVVTADCLNAVQEELAGVIEGLGGVLDPENSSQLFDWIVASLAMKVGSASQVFRVAAAVDPNDAVPLSQMQAALLGGVLYSDTRFKRSTLVRSTAAGAGNVAYTGFGFAPKAVIFLGAVDSSLSKYASLGLHAYASGAGIYTDGSSNTPSIGGGSTLEIYQDPTNYTTGNIVSLDADGFTIGWNKLGNQTTVSITFYYLAFR